MTAVKKKAYVVEMFRSISGEIGAVSQGTPMLFIRLAGCNLNCSYCDTPESHVMEEKHLTPLGDILRFMDHHPGVPDVMITGGEPLLQPYVLDWIMYRRGGYYPPRRFHIETNGTIRPTGEVFKQANLVFDYKMDYPEKMVLKPYEYYVFPNKPTIKYVVGDVEELYSAIDHIKLVIQARPDNYITSPQFAVSTYNRNQLPEQSILAELEFSNLPFVKINAQLHKLLGFR